MKAYFPTCQFEQVILGFISSQHSVNLGLGLGHVQGVQNVAFWLLAGKRWHDDVIAIVASLCWLPDPQVPV